MYEKASLRIRLLALGILLWELALLVFTAGVSLVLLGAASSLVAHFLFGYPWAWEKTHEADWLLFSVLVAAPLLLLGGLAWMALRDEYRRILQTRMQKW